MAPVNPSQQVSRGQGREPTPPPRHRHRHAACQTPLAGADVADLRLLWQRQQVRRDRIESRNQYFKLYAAYQQAY